MDQREELHKALVFDGTVGTIVPKTPSNHFYHQVGARFCSPNDIWLQIPDRYVDQSDQALVVEIPSLGRYETIPDYAKTQKIHNCAAIAIGILALLAPYILIGVFSGGFKRGEISTPIQRGFVMSWLVVGQLFGALIGLNGYKDSKRGNLFYKTPLKGIFPREYFKEIDDFSDDLELPHHGVYGRLLTGIFAVLVITPALGGLVVVGFMIKQFGSCVLV